MAARRDFTRESLAAGVRAGDKRALARAITLVENSDPLAYELVRDVYPETGRAYAVGITGPARRRQVEPDLVARPPRPRGRQDGRRHLRRPLEPLLARGAARRPDPSLRPFPRSRGVHPLNGDPRTPRRPRGSDAAGAARTRRRRQGARLSRDGRGRPKRGRGDRD